MSVPAARADGEIVVTSAADPGNGTCDAAECTLREAISLANGRAGTDTITFAIGTGAVTISPVQALPDVLGTAVIDATTQPGYAGVPLVEVSGAAAPLGASGLVLAGGASSVSGLVLNAFLDGSGIVLAGTGGHVLRSSYVGTDPSGTAARPNWRGVSVLSANNVIGDVGAGNLVSGNDSTRHRSDSVGIEVIGPAAVGNRVVSNLVGVRASGVGALRNGLGLGVANAPGTIVGGPNPGEGNVFSGNVYQGIRLVGAGTSGSVVQGNVVGLDASGAPLGNGLDAGVRLKATKNTAIGGTAPGAGNIISGNEYGIRITERATGTVIQGNRIGTDATGTFPRGNRLQGISVKASKTTTIGGEEPGAANTVAFNGLTGVLLAGGTSSPVLSNRIFSNGTLGIDLGSTGVTPNDAGDADAGANLLQNWPVVTDVAADGGSTTVQGVLQTSANRTYRVQLFANDACDASGNGEGARLLATASVVVGGTGSQAFTVVIGEPLAPTEVVTATATDPANNTSELSPCVGHD